MLKFVVVLLLIDYFKMNSALSMGSWPLPFHYQLKPHLKQGQSLHVVGYLNYRGRLDINLATGPDADFDIDDILLHVSFRNKHLVLNARVGGSWIDEKSREQEVEPFTTFDILISFDYDRFEVLFNGKFAGGFPYIGPLEAIEYLNINGNAHIEGVNFKSRAIPLPFESEPAPLRLNDALYVSGVPSPDADRYMISFLAGDRYIFHFEIRFKDNVIIRNHRDHLGWGWEDRSKNTLFKIGEPFYVNIYHTFVDYKIYVNGHHYFSYHHRYFGPKDKVRHRVEGDGVETSVIYFGSGGVHRMLMFRN